MGQYSIYLNEKVDKLVQNDIKSTGENLSGYIQRLIMENHKATWSESFVKLAGALKNLPLERGEESCLPSDDTPREPF